VHSFLPVLSSPYVLTFHRTKVGVTDAVYGERVCAWVIPKPGRSVSLQSVREFCRDQLAHYKVPEFVFSVAEFPLTVTGKVQKFQMRAKSVEWVAQGLGRS
jgi:fatty-acyl-CoA synthase